MPEQIKLEHDPEQNRHQIDKIEFWSRDNNYYLGLRFINEECAADFLSDLGIILIEHMDNNNNLHFLLVKHHLSLKNPIVLKGNIAQVLQIFTEAGVIPADIINLLNDPDEYEIKSILENSSKFTAYTAKPNAVSIFESNLFKTKQENIVDNKDKRKQFTFSHKSNSCTIS